MVEILMAHEEILPAEQKGIAFAAGIHPWHLNEGNRNKLAEFMQKVAPHPAVVAIGEAGFDRLRGPGIELQREVFDEQVRLACQLGKPVLVGLIIEDTRQRVGWIDLQNRLAFRHCLPQFGPAVACRPGLHRHPGAGRAQSSDRGRGGRRRRDLRDEQRRHGRCWRGPQNRTLTRDARAFRRGCCARREATAPDVTVRGTAADLGKRFIFAAEAQIQSAGQNYPGAG